ncbi:hypothetical protein O6P43_009178 [Quillaja saponaria]|uniref:Uncharacterized protein n=1 Tax=Quillaja saponaria TaxID=32244 RepID=A0AAD7PXP8_QUISA|nr:hypothetical protein O6P43_009178 [Quillaja saponaria]
MSIYDSIALVFMVVMMVTTVDVAVSAAAGSGCIGGSIDGCLGLINMIIGEADEAGDHSSELLTESHWGRMLFSFNKKKLLTPPTKNPYK